MWLVYRISEMSLWLNFIHSTGAFLCMCGDQVGVHSRTNFNDLSGLTKYLKYFSRHYIFSISTFLEVYVCVLKDAVTVFSQYTKRTTGKYPPSRHMKKQRTIWIKILLNITMLKIMPYGVRDLGLSPVSYVMSKLLNLSVELYVKWE